MRIIIMMFARIIIGVLAIIGIGQVINSALYHDAIIECSLNGAKLTVLNEGCESRGCLSVPGTDEIEGVISIAEGEKLLAGYAAGGSDGESCFFIVEMPSFAVSCYLSIPEFYEALANKSEVPLVFHSALYMATKHRP